jgi:hypothetical protein
LFNHVAHGRHRRINSQPGGEDGPTITFNNDVAGGPSTDVAVDPKLAQLIENVVIETGYSININSTTGGVRGPSSSHPTGHAVDINRINGTPVSDPMIREQVVTLQSAFVEHEYTRQLIGPAGDIIKRPPSGKSARAIIDAHWNHIHVSSKR